VNFHQTVIVVGSHIKQLLLSIFDVAAVVNYQKLYISVATICNKVLYFLVPARSQVYVVKTISKLRTKVIEVSYTSMSGTFTIHTHINFKKTLLKLCPNSCCLCKVNNKLRSNSLTVLQMSSLSCFEVILDLRMQATVWRHISKTFPS
jgi:hypothetical protein